MICFVSLLQEVSPAVFSIHSGICREVLVFKKKEIEIMSV